MSGEFTLSLNLAHSKQTLVLSFQTLRKCVSILFVCAKALQWRVALNGGEMVSTPRLVLYVGLAGLLHAAYSATQHRSYLRLTEQEFVSLPADIIVQTLISFVVVCIGVIGVSGPLKEIEAAAEFKDKSWDCLKNRPSFQTFHNRNLTLSAFRTNH
ncbi:Membrane magnesium transporter 1 [Clonorchis sinensis]|uniref:Membrane magnesium transporter n=1 Tax=Clonorchis sinensis TaxID=79923 RepID=A0A8T1M2G8_CLOSI|nr:Membrane magnesium transporter 1 [Clonorchis sinensis]